MSKFLKQVGLLTIPIWSTMIFFSIVHFWSVSITDPAVAFVFFLWEIMGVPIYIVMINVLLFKRKKPFLLRQLISILIVFANSAIFCVPSWIEFQNGLRDAFAYTMFWLFIIIPAVIMIPFEIAYILGYFIDLSDRKTNPTDYKP